MSASVEETHKNIHILRHGQAIHKIQRGYPLRDPPLTEQGLAEARDVSLNFQPDLILCSPMPILKPLSKSGRTCGKHTMPSATRACRATLNAAYRELDFSQCNEEWDYEAHSDEAATRRAERVRAALAKRPEQNILLVSHHSSYGFL
ncbi:hypothetical protein C8R43DRAFT_1016058 [Mycena crocata]|nr:hypothetical protein C8R43DRAFT_1016058 [Mycena crocata]